MLHRRGFSAGLLLGGVVPSIVSPGPSAGESLIVQCSFSPTSYFTVFWADTRAVKGESLGTVRINDNFCGLKLFRGDTDEADPSVSAYIGGSLALLAWFRLITGTQASRLPHPKSLSR